MELVDFTLDHIEEAKKILKSNYEEEKKHIPFLPDIETFPDLSGFAENELGVVAIDDNKEMLGFLCCHDSSEMYSGSVKGVFSPIHAHGTIKKHRTKIYDNLYQTAAEKWVSKNIFTHEISLYAHDKRAINIFFNNGFGIRTGDAIREVTPINEELQKLDIRKIPATDSELLVPLCNDLIKLLNRTPMFMPLCKEITKEDIEKSINTKEVYYFGVYEAEKIIAYINLKKNGDNFICSTSNILNIKAAYCLPQYRNKKIYTALFAWLMEWLKKGGYNLCGVDYETFNPSIRRFWSKYFITYNNGMIRRIDEGINN